MEHHVAASSFPMMDEKRFSELKADIEANGLREPITVYDGQILDGRNRYRACNELGIKPETREYDGDPWAYVWSLNGERRDLVAEQRYLIWRECVGRSEEWKAEQERIQQAANEKRSKAAKAGKVGRAAAKAKSNGDEFSSGTECATTESKAGDKKGQHSRAASSHTNRGAVTRGDKLANQRPDLAEKVRLGQMRPAEAHRQMKRDEVSGRAAELPKGQYTVLYADPPWKYGDAQAVKGEYGTGTGSALGHYPCMSLPELKSLDVPSFTAEDSVLFLWATSPLLPDAIELIKAWGFTYKASFVWDKIKHNMGHYNSVRHELLLICTKGSCMPRNNKLFDSVQSIERSKHSEKPSRFREIIETLYPNDSKIEMFARSEHEGWDCYGNEC